MGHTHESFDTDGALIADTTVTAGTGITATTGDIAATAGAVTAGTDVAATRSVTGAAIYGPSVAQAAGAGLPFVGFQCDGGNPPTFSYWRCYDDYYKAYVNYRVYKGALCVVL
jgi:hypothetical protein